MSTLQRIGRASRGAVGFLGEALTPALLLLLAVPPLSASALCVGGAPNGTREAGEECDDGNAAVMDGCDASCDVEAGWSCDSPVLFTTITPESYPGASANWVVASDGRSAEQTTNTGHGTIGLFGADAKAATYSFSISSSNADNDRMGFVVGFVPGDTTDAGADYLLLDWDQSNAGSVGLVLSRVQGLPTAGELFSRNGPVSILARAATVGDVGWVRSQVYSFVFTYTDSSLRVTVDGVEEFNISATAAGFAGGFPNGQLGFYGLSQANVSYSIDGPFGSSSCNRAPSVADQTVARTLGDALTVVDVLTGFSDPDGDAPNGASVVALTLPTAATVTDPTAGAADGTLELTPDDPAAGISYAFTFQLCDDHPTIPLCDRGTITVVTCGDGVTGFGESCDDGFADDCGTCNATCTGPGTGSCGDGTVCPETEMCDDGFTDACGSCNADCSGPGSTPVCGDGDHCPELEACDDGFTDACGSCNVDCTDVGAGAVCGDTSLCPEVEMCDDGNVEPDDGCSPTCMVEVDGGMPDAGPPDAGVDSDAGAIDAGTDAGAPDAAVDAGAMDGGSRDAGPGGDASSPDAGPPGPSGTVVGGFCAVRASGRSGAGWVLALLGLVAIGRRRRR